MGEREAKLRIGELSRRTGVSTSVLRAWELRYGLMSPERTEGRLRLYSAEEEQRVRTMQSHIRSGLSAAEAARAVLRGERASAPPAAPASLLGGTGDSELAMAARALAGAMARLDQSAAQEALDELLAAASFETVATDVLLPYLAELGSRWRRGEATIAEEHLATQVMRSRLLGLARARRPREGTSAVLACPPGELHDIALMMLAVALERRGWLITLLGADTPIDVVREAATTVDCDCVVVAANHEDRIASVAGELAALNKERVLLLAGPGAAEPLAREIGAQLLTGNPISVAEDLAAMTWPRRQRPAG